MGTFLEKKINKINCEILDSSQHVKVHSIIEQIEVFCHQVNGVIIDFLKENSSLPSPKKNSNSKKKRAELDLPEFILQDYYSNGKRRIAVISKLGIDDLCFFFIPRGYSISTWSKRNNKNILTKEQIKIIELFFENRMNIDIYFSNLKKRLNLLLEQRILKKKVERQEIKERVTGSKLDNICFNNLQQDITYYKLLDSKSLKPIDLLEKRSSSTMGYSDKYLMRDIDTQISKCIEKREHVLLVAKPLAGKTRAIFQYLKSISPDNVIIILNSINFNKKGIEELKKVLNRKQSFFVVFNDIDKFNTDLLPDIINYLINVYSNLILLGTCRYSEFSKVKKALFEKNLLESDFQINQLEIKPLSVEEKKRIDFGITPRESRDDTIGSYFVDLSAMKECYNNLSCAENAVLRTRKILYLWRSNNRGEKFIIQNYCKKFNPIEFEKFGPGNWIDLYSKLENLGFLIYNDDAIGIEDAYLTFIDKNCTEIQYAKEVVGIYPTTLAYTKLLTRLTNNTDVFTLLEHMESEKVGKSNVTYTVLIKRSSTLEQGIDFYNKLSKDKNCDPPSSYSINALLRHCTNQQDRTKILKLAITDDIDIKSYSCNIALRQCQNFTDVSEIVNLMTDHGVELDVYSISTIISTVLNFSITQLFSLLKDKYIQPNIINEVVIKKIFYKITSFDDTRQVVEFLLKLDKSIPTDIFNVSLHNISYDDSLKVVLYAESQDIEIDTWTINSLFDKVKTDEIETGWKLFERFDKKPDTTSFNIKIKNKPLEDGIEIVKKLLALDSDNKPDKFTKPTLLTKCDTQSDLERVKQLLPKTLRGAESRVFLQYIRLCSNFKEGINLLNDKKNTPSVHQITELCKKITTIEEFELFNEVIDKFKIEHNDVSQKELMKCRFALNLIDTLNDFHLLLQKSSISDISRIITLMKEKKCEPNTDTLKIIISKQVGIKFFTELFSEKGLKYERVNDLIVKKLMYQITSFGDVKEFFSFLSSSNITIKADRFNIVLSSHCNLNFNDAFESVVYAKSMDVNIERSTINSLLAKANSNTDEIELAWGLFKICNKKPDIDSFNIKIGNIPLKGAIEIVEKLLTPDSDDKPDEFTKLKLLRKCTTQCDLEKVEQLLPKTLIEPKSDIFSQYIRLCSNFEVGINLLKDKRNTPQVYQINELYKKITTIEELELLEEILKEHNIEHTDFLKAILNRTKNKLNLPEISFIHKIEAFNNSYTLDIYSYINLLGMSDSVEDVDLALNVATKNNLDYEECIKKYKLRLQFIIDNKIRKTADFEIALDLCRELELRNTPLDSHIIDALLRISKKQEHRNFIHDKIQKYNIKIDGYVAKSLIDVANSLQEASNIYSKIQKPSEHHLKSLIFKVECFNDSVFIRDLLENSRSESKDSQFSLFTDEYLPKIINKLIRNQLDFERSWDVYNNFNREFGNIKIDGYVAKSLIDVANSLQEASNVYSKIEKPNEYHLKSLTFKVECFNDSIYIRDLLGDSKSESKDSQLSLFTDEYLPKIINKLIRNQLDFERSWDVYNNFNREFGNIKIGGYVAKFLIDAASSLQDASNVYSKIEKPNEYHLKSLTFKVECFNDSIFIRDLLENSESEFKDNQISLFTDEYLPKIINKLIRSQHGFERSWDEYHNFNKEFGIPLNRSIMQSLQKKYILSDQKQRVYTYLKKLKGEVVESDFIQSELIRFAKDFNQSKQIFENIEIPTSCQVKLFCSRINTTREALIANKIIYNIEAKNREELIEYYQCRISYLLVEEIRKCKNFKSGWECYTLFSKKLNILPNEHVASSLLNLCQSKYQEKEVRKIIKIFKISKNKDIYSSFIRLAKDFNGAKQILFSITKPTEKHILKTLDKSERKEDVEVIINFIEKITLYKKSKDMLYNRCVKRRTTLINKGNK